MTDKDTLKSRIEESLGSTKLYPPLANAYRSAVGNICSSIVNVAEKHFPKVIARQNQILNEKYALDTYAYTIVKAYWPWCQSKNMRSVPIHIFCGKKAWEKFLEIQESTVRLDRPVDVAWSEDVHAELNAAKMYIQATLTGRVASIGTFRRYMDRPDPDDSIVAEVKRLLRLAYGVHGDDYYDMAVQISRLRMSRIKRTARDRRVR